MDTFSRDFTRTFFNSDDGFAALERHWRRMVNAPDRPRLLAAHYLLYQVARGKNYRRGFTLPTNPVKLANGQLEGSGLRRALQVIKYAARCPEGSTATELLAPFSGILSREALPAIAESLPSTSGGYVRVQDLEIGYGVPDAALSA